MMLPNCQACKMRWVSSLARAHRLQPLRPNHELASLEIKQVTETVTGVAHWHLEAILVSSCGTLRPPDSASETRILVAFRDHDVLLVLAAAAAGLHHL